MYDVVFGMALHFEVDIDGVDLGTWSKVEGLTVEFGVLSHSTGNDDHVTLTPGRTSYQSITLTRPVTPASKAVTSWLTLQKRKPFKGTGVIVLMDAARLPVMTWELAGVLPLKWSGPNLDVSTSGVAMETLVLAHEGFLY
ncbi:MAG TPA: phage tail protein [Candidatus Dormibacteraeota bacterium]|jgi:phage tail-like protein